MSIYPACSLLINSLGLGLRAFIWEPKGDEADIEMPCHYLEAKGLKKSPQDHSYNVIPSHTTHHQTFLPLLASVQGALIHLLVILGADVVDAAIVAKPSPLRVDAHPAFISVHQLDVPHFLHVAHIASCPWKESQGDFSPQKTTRGLRQADECHK